MKALEVKNLVKNYKEIQAVKNVSFDIAEKEILAIVGPNGAGKSTILKIVATILSPTSGGKAKVEYGYDLPVNGGSLGCVCAI